MIRESVDSRVKADHRCVFGMKGLTLYQREIEEKLDEGIGREGKPTKDRDSAWQDTL